MQDLPPANYLPDEVWFYIFRMIPFRSLLRVTTVSTSWCTLAYRSVISFECQEDDWLTENRLDQFPNLQFLGLNSSRLSVTDEGLCKMLGLTALDLAYNSHISNNGVSALTNLTYLDLRSMGDFSEISDDGLLALTRITNLDLSENDFITDDAIQCLTNLVTLSLRSNGKVTNDGLSTLTNLTSLDLESNSSISDAGLQPFAHSLTDLDLTKNTLISDHGLSTLTNLRALDLKDNIRITDAAVTCLTKLMYLGTDQGISYDVLTGLTNLTQVDGISSLLDANPLLQTLKERAVAEREQVNSLMKLRHLRVRGLFTPWS